MTFIFEFLIYSITIFVLLYKILHISKQKNPLYTMKNAILVLILSFLSFHAYSQNSKKQVQLKNTLVETACGECKFKLEGKSCDLAIRYKGVAYFVDGTGINDHGDAHDKDGFCNSIRKAEVTGTIENGRFKSTSFKLMPKKAKSGK